MIAVIQVVLLWMNFDYARYQYYLHLKTEILDGRLQCSPEQAIVLAAYSVQGEFGTVIYIDRQ